MPCNAQRAAIQIDKSQVFIVIVALALIVFSYDCLDREIVSFLVQHHSRQFIPLKILANDIVIAIIGFVFLYYGYVVIQFSRRCLRPTDKHLLVVCNAVVIAFFLKDISKFIFGRYWPSTFIGNNPSLIETQAYGFQWFNGSPLSLSFPSGHAAVIFAFSTSAWYLFPKLRPLWALLAVLVVVGQVGMYYHFLSDAIAGALLGVMVGVYNHRFWTQSLTEPTIPF